jgi:hypothetical protein
MVEPRTRSRRGAFTAQLIAICVRAVREHTGSDREGYLVGEGRSPLLLYQGLFRYNGGCELHTVLRCVER